MRCTFPWSLTRSKIPSGTTKVCKPMIFTIGQYHLKPKIKRQILVLCNNVKQYREPNDKRPHCYLTANPKSVTLIFRSSSMRIFSSCPIQDLSISHMVYIKIKFYYKWERTFRSRWTTFLLCMKSTASNNCCIMILVFFSDSVTTWFK